MERAGLRARPFRAIKPGRPGAVAGHTGGVRVRPLAPGDAETCDAIIASLPYFFAIEEGVKECSLAVRTQSGWVAVDGAGQVVGFLTTDTPFPGSVEITWLAVRGHRRRAGAGRVLIERAAQEAARQGHRCLCVLTLGPSASEPGVEDGYAGTRRFYERVGFLPLKELRLSAWGGEHALVLVRVLESEINARPV